MRVIVLFFFFQAEDGIRDLIVTGVQTCALPIWRQSEACASSRRASPARSTTSPTPSRLLLEAVAGALAGGEIGRGSGRGKGEILGGGLLFKKKKSGD